MYLDAQRQTDPATASKAGAPRASPEPCAASRSPSRSTARKKWADDMAPAIELASKGFPVSTRWPSRSTANKHLANSPESKRIFLKDGAHLRAWATRLSSRSWPKRSKRIAKDGAKEFYEGETARLLAEEMAKQRRPDHARRSRRITRPWSARRSRERITATPSSPRRLRAPAASRCSKCWHARWHRI